MADILTGLAQEIQRHMETPVVIITLIHLRMVFQVLTVVDGSLFDLADRSIDTTNCFYFIYGLRPIARTVFDHPARGPQIGQSMEIIRMISLSSRWSCICRYGNEKKTCRQ